MRSKSIGIKIGIVAVAAFALLITSCKPKEADPLIASNIEVLSGNSQSGIISTELAAPIEIIIKDQNGNGFKEAKVVFETSIGSISAADAITNIEGKATVNWTLGATEGTQTLIITAFKSDGTTPLAGSPITVKATGTAIEAVTLALHAGDGQVGYTNTTLEYPVVVKVTDHKGDLFEGAMVNFSVTEGVVSVANAITNSQGLAEVEWTFGSTVGNQNLIVTAFKSDGTVLSNSPLTVTARADEPPLEARTIELASGGGQTAIIETELANPIVFRVLDQNNNPFSGAAVHFKVTEGSISGWAANLNVVLVADNQGFISTDWVLGSTIGTQTLSVSATINNDSINPLINSPMSVTATGISNTITDIDGNTYDIVAIGNQFWMAENLATITYANGTAIPQVGTANWGTLTNSSKATISSTPTARLYTWAAASNGVETGVEETTQGACPTGWHLPSRDNFVNLVNILGGSNVAGGKLKETGIAKWNAPNTGATNSSGFSAQGLGYIDVSGNFNGVSVFTNYWSSHVLVTGATTLGLFSGDAKTTFSQATKRQGLSIRCVKD